MTISTSPISLIDIHDIANLVEDMLKHAPGTTRYCDVVVSPALYKQMLTSYENYERMRFDGIGSTGFTRMVLQTYYGTIELKCSVGVKEEFDLYLSSSEGHCLFFKDYAFNKEMMELL